MVKDLKSLLKLFRELYPYATLALFELFIEDPTRFLIDEFLAQLQKHYHQITIYSNDSRVVFRSTDILVERGFLYQQFLNWRSNQGPTMGQSHQSDQEQAKAINEQEFETLVQLPQVFYGKTGYHRCDKSWFKVLSPKSLL